MEEIHPEDMSLRGLLETHLSEDIKNFESVNDRLNSQDHILQEIKGQNIHQIKQNEKILEITSQNAEMYELFNDGKTLTKVFKWAFRVTVALGGAYLMIRTIIKL